MPKLVMDYVRPLMPDLSDKTLWCMEKDILQHEVDGHNYGDPSIDVPAWLEFLAQIQQEISRRKEENAIESGTTPPIQIVVPNIDSDKNLDVLMDHIIDNNLEALHALAMHTEDGEPTYHSYHRVIDDVR